MRRSIFFAAWVSLLWANNAVAQLEESDTARWQLNSNLSLRLNTGNVERLIVTPEANIAHVSRNKGWGFSARQRYTYGTFGTIRTENDLLSRNFIYLSPESRVYPYLMAWFQTHARQRMDFRYQIGPGITLVLLRKEFQVLKVSLTGTYEHNWYAASGLTYLEDRVARDYSVVRGTSRIFGSHLFSPGIVSVYYELLFQQALGNIENWRIFGESGINTRIVNGFSMRTYLNFEYQQVHVATEKPNDLILNVGINYKVSSEQQ